MSRRFFFVLCALSVAGTGLLAWSLAPKPVVNQPEVIELVVAAIDPPKDPVPEKKQFKQSSKPWKASDLEKKLK